MKVYLSKKEEIKDLSPRSPGQSYKIFQGSLRNQDSKPPENPSFTKNFYEKQNLKLNAKQAKVNKNRARHTKLKQKFEVIQSLIQKTIEDLKTQENEDQLMHRSSIKIQKVFRGFITRKKIEQKIFNTRQDKITQNLNSMNQDKDFLMYNVGKMPEISATIIQKAYKRYKARCYFNRLLETYKLIQLHKEEANFRNLREKLTVLVSVGRTKQKAFEKYRAERLEVIKERLALIKIKELFRKMKLGKNNIVEKIKKFKRRLRAAQKKMIKRSEGAGEERTEDFVGGNCLVMDDEEDFETTTSEREAQERMKELKRLEEERKVKIRYGKISHNLRELKLPKILTTRQHKEVPLAEIKEVKPRIRPKLPKPIEKNDSFIHKAENEEPSYMRATISFNLSKITSKAESFDDSITRFSGQIRDNTTLFEPTKASLLKITRRRSLSVEIEENFDLRQSSNQFISVKIKEKPKSPAKVYNEKIQVQKKQVSSQAFTILPQISTKHQNFPVKVKPRSELMKGFTKVTRINDSIFDFM